MKTIKSYEMIVSGSERDIVFDVQVRDDTRSIWFTVAPKVQGGCVLMELSRYDNECIIQSIIHDTNT